MQKMGNHISLQALGYTKLPFTSDQTLSQKVSNKILLKLNVTNHGLSDQVHDDIALYIHNKNFKLLKPDDGSLYQTQKPMSLVQVEKTKGAEFAQEYYLNGIKAHSSKVFEIPIYLMDPAEKHGFYDNFTGALETTVTYNEFTTSSKPKNAVLVFNSI